MLTLFLVKELSNSNLIEISGDNAHHAIKVLRIKVGEKLLLSDGVGNWARVEVSKIGKNDFEVSVLERGVESERTPRLIVIQGLPKSDRVKETIEILVEAGADVIIPWEAERSISKWQEQSLAKWQSGVSAATMQSRRFRAPLVLDQLSLSQILELESPTSLLIAMHESADLKLSKILAAELAKAGELSEIIIVIGPEGGLSERELTEFTSAGAKIAGLGPEIFRSAHAGGATLSAISALIGRW